MSGSTTVTGTRTGIGPDLWAVALAVLLVALAIGAGSALQREHGTLRVGWPPFFARWDPHLGPGSAAAVLLAVAVIAWGPPLAARLPWRRLLLTAWATAMAWTWSLALIDGWQRGAAQRLTTRYEYLREIGRFDDIGAALRGFTGHILLGSPDHWVPHVAGHPPGAILTFVGLDRAGLGGGAWAAAWCVTVGASAAVAVLVTVRALTGEERARSAAPFVVAAPAAVWVGVSADGYFTGVAAWSLALLALAATRKSRAPRATALAAGLLFGLTCYLSYGLTLCALLAGAVLVLARTARPLPYALTGAALVALAFTLTGFNWWEGYRLLTERYYQGAAAIRPYGYWVWANLACTAIVIGPATVAGLRRTLAGVPGAVGGLRRGGTRMPSHRNGPGDVHGTPPDDGPGSTHPLVLLVLAALLALLVADLSGMSKAETERIWLPLALWTLPAAALLPRPGARGWLCAQTALALVVNHLLLTGW
ncbi:hypothetical protein [Streptomyces axinellae]|uniref:hypothetical protein n=1 Tax=Streptomyces axinellae TaxID=552788 RepID=UPI003CD0C061